MGPLRERFKNWILEGRKSRKMLLFIVYIALFLDNMLLTTVGKWRRYYVEGSLFIRASNIPVQFPLYPSTSFAYGIRTFRNICSAPMLARQRLGVWSACSSPNC